MKTKPWSLLCVLLRHPAGGVPLHRLRLRLRTRWLAWRGVSSLRLIRAGEAAQPEAAAVRQRREGREHALRLVEFNLMLERARAGQERRGHPGGMAR